MRASMLCASLICLLWGTIANGAEENLAGLKAVQQGEYVDLGSKAGNEITLKRTRGGAIAFLAAPSGTHFEVPGIAVSAHEAIALAFVRQHAGVFGVESSKVAFKTKRITSNKRVYNVRLEQTIDGVPVYGGEMMIHVLDTGGVLSARIDILRDTSSFDSGKLVAIPILSAKEAEARAVDAVITTMVSEGYPVGILTAQDSEFVIFDSAVLMDVQAPPKARLEGHRA